MIRLEVFGDAETMASVAELLDGSEDVGRVRLVGAMPPGHAVVAAVAASYDVADLSIQEPAIEDVIRELYSRDG